VFLSSWKYVLRINVNIMFRAVEIIVFDIVNVGLVQTNGINYTFLFWNAWVLYYSGFVCRKTKFFLLISCVLLRSKYILIYFSHSESKFGCKLQSFTVFLSSWKCVLRIKVNIMFRAVEIILFDIVNFGLVQTSGNHVHVSLLKRLSVILQWYCM
jgi:hypothetical protein